MLRNWLSDFTNLRRIFPTQKRRQARRRHLRLAPVSRHAEILEDRTMLAGVMYNAATDQLDFNADLTELDNVTVSAAGANTLVIQVGNGDAISLSGDASPANGFTLSTTVNPDDTLTIDTSISPLVNFSIDVEDMNDSLILTNNLSAVITGTLTIDGRTGDDILDASLGGVAAFINGGGGIDTIDGGSGNDTITGGLGVDIINAGGGADLIIWNEGDGDETINGGVGNDEVVINTVIGDQTIVITPITADTFQAARTSSPPFILTISDGETLSLNTTAGDDTITIGDILTGGGVTVVNIDSGAGDDTIDGGAYNGDFTINGGDGNDTITGGGGIDILNGGSGNDTITGMGGDDTIDGGDGDDTLSGSGGNDTIIGADGTDTLNGNDGNDVLDGGAGGDVVNGDVGNDTISGGGGADILFGNATEDTFNITPNLTGGGVITVSGGTPTISPGDVLNYFGSANAVNTPSGVGSGTITDLGFDDVIYTGIESVNLIPPAELSIGDAQIIEGTGGTTTLIFTVTLSDITLEPVTVEVDTLSGTAITGTDFLGVSETLTFAPGESLTQTVSVSINPDAIVELNEQFTVTLSNATGATITDGEATGTILDDDGPATVSIGNVSQVEGNSGTTNFVFTVTLNQTVDADVTFNAQTIAGTATAGIDFVTLASTPITFAAGSVAGATQTITVQVNGDVIVELDETFSVQLSNLAASGRDVQFTGGTSTLSATGTILNDDGSATVSIGNVSQVEGNSGTTNFVFTVTLDQTVDADVTFNAQTIAGTATAGSDFVALASTPITFSAGSLAGATQTITVQVNGDVIVEPDETFSVQLTDLDASGRDVQFTGGTSTLSATGTIQNDDGTATISINSVTQMEGDGASSQFVFTVTLDRPVDVAISVEASTAVAFGPNAAVPGVDFTTTTQVVTFQPGQTTQMFSVVVFGATIQEFDDIFLVKLDNLDASGRAVQISGTNGTGTGTILNDDSMLVAAAGFGGGPHVRVFDQFGNARLSFLAFDGGFIGGVRVAAGDMTGDGTPDIIAAAGPGGGPHVRIFDGVTGLQIAGNLGSFFVYDAGFTGGVFVALGDLTGDGQLDLITGAGQGGGPHVRAIDGNTGAELLSFLAFDAGFTGGVHVAAGDVTGDGRPEIVTGSGFGIQSRVRTFDGTTGLQIAGPLGDFFAYNPNFLGGTFVAVGDVNGDMREDIITGADAYPAGGPHIRAFSGIDGSELLTYFAHDSNFSGGIRIAVGDVTGDGRVEIISGQGPGAQPHVQTFDGTTGQRIPGPLGSFFAFDVGFTGGVFVAGVVPAPAPIFNLGVSELATFDVLSFSESDSLDNEISEESDDWDPDQLFAEESLLEAILTEEFV